ncbi:MAG: D-hexose-6-phosphate mutarotase [Neptuniibacter sp.]
MNLAEQLQELYQKFGELPGISIELHKQLIAVAVDNKSAKATIFLQGAQVAEYQQKGQQPLLWLSDQCDFKAGKSLRGGIPICWPWFGNLECNPEQVRSQFPADAPAHGFVRDREWNLDSIELVDPSTTELVLSLNVQPDGQWPFTARLQLKVTVAEQLRLEFTVTNRGDDRFSFTSALHTYFNISGIEAVSVSGLEGVRYLDTLNEWKAETDETPVNVAGEVDRVYQNLDKPVRLSDSGFNRAIRLDSDNAPDMVLWNPWQDKAKRLSHFADDAYQKMICLESAHVLDNLKTLEPDESFVMQLFVMQEGLAQQA